MIANDNPAQPTLEDPVHGEGVSDSEQTASPINELAYGGVVSTKTLAFGGNDSSATIAAQGRKLYRLERGFPIPRRGTLLPAVPRTKAETIYSKDPAQALQNRVLNTGASGTGTSGIALSGTTNKPNATTGAINRYRTPYKTNLQ